MGLAGRRRPPLPAPTESSAFDTGSESPPPIEPSDLETNLTTRTDKTHWSVPEDGSPVVIRTEKLRAKPKNITLKNRNKDGSSSQTSLLIEYFEGDKDDEDGVRKPSVRVRVTPSAKKKDQEARAGESTRGVGRVETRRRSSIPDHEQRISLGKARQGVLPLTESNISSFEGSELSETPREFDLQGTDQNRDTKTGADLYIGEESRLAPINMSEISSMPADSMLATDLGTESPTKPLGRRRSRSLEREVETGNVEKLKPSNQRSRSLSRERIVARRAVEKFEREARERRHKEKDRESKSRSGKSKSRSASAEYLASTPGKPRRKSSKSYDKEEEISNLSPLTGSALSGNSAQSGNSAASTLSKNPKLLQTVEDAIRRLILPEINALKNEQKSHRRSDRYDDELSSNASSARSEERSSRRVSGSRSGPKLKLNGDTIKSNRGSRRSGGSRGSVDSLKREFERASSEEIREDKSRRRSKDKARDLATGAAVAGLTYEALKSRDSASSIERRERRKKRSKSHSRSDSRADSVEDIFNKHDVPPMPMTGGLTDSDLTRESILSERTSTPTHDRNREVRDLVKDSPSEPSPGGSITPTGHMSPARDREADFAGGQRFGESVHLKKEPYREPAYDDWPGQEDEEDEDIDYQDGSAGHYAQDRPYMPMMGMYSANNYSDPAYGFQKRGLSPIQSVASYEERGEPPPDHQHSRQSSTSVSFAERDLQSDRSFDPAVAGIDHGKLGSLHAKSASTGNAQDVLLGQGVRYLGANPELIDSPHRAESAVASLMDHSTAGERSNISYGSSEANSAEQRYSIDTDPRRASIVGQERNMHTPERSSPLKRELRHDDLEEEMMQGYGYGRPSNVTPPKDKRGSSTMSSPFETNPIAHGNVIRTLESPMRENENYDEDVETNPSEIRDDPWEDKHATHSGSAHDSLRAAAKNMLLAAGAMGTGAAIAAHEKGDAGNYDEMDLDSYSPPHTESPGSRGVPDSPSLQKPKIAPGVSPWQPLEFTPLAPLDRDEGYSSGLPRGGVPSDGSITPEAKGLFADINPGGHVADDPFTTPPTKRDRPTTADSDAMPSPLYDAATGRGVDRIKNQDIVALMDHLTVRDAQRNARDTEILITLVRSAAEMRNSFEDMKRMMATQEERALDANNKQHVETRKAIGGPRAMPANRAAGGSSSGRASAAEMNPDDIPAKKRNIFRKALRGLGGAKKEDLANIEDMLMQLLDEVADIKAVQQIPQAGGYVPPKMSSGLTSYEQLRDAPSGAQDVYQPSGQTSSGNRNDSGYSSGNSSYRPAHNRYGSEALRNGQNRVSTVHEDDEEDSPETPIDERDQKLLGHDEADEMLTPTREFRGGSIATGAPHTSNRQSLSVENTPNTRKHRSGSSSFFPKISRWSKTTASSVPGLDQTPRQEQGQTQYSQQTPSKQRDQRPVSELSRSASDLAEGDYDVRDHYDPSGDDRLRSKTSLSNHSASKEYRPPSPLIPSTVSEKPTYSAHRDSKDLQHPQPRQGPTARFQNHLESEAARGWYQDGGAATAATAESPNSDVMGSNPVLSRFGGGRERGDRYSGASYGAQGAEELGTIIESTSATTSVAGGPPRPPKVKDEGPLVPPKVLVEQQNTNTRTVSFASDRMAQITGGAQSRKPTGPRPITRTGSASPAAGQSFSDWKKNNQYRGSPNHIPSDDDSETF